GRIPSCSPPGPMTRTGEMRICSLIRVVILSAMGLVLSCLRISHLCQANARPAGRVRFLLQQTDVQISLNCGWFANGRGGQGVEGTTKCAEERNRGTERQFGFAYFACFVVSLVVSCFQVDANCYG